ncbi:unnamed protein product [Amoebophrya sp. A120]|nr:unnamed protein product [Amoebophrya sp. A120]|eukprot:GSA120T00002779001.1
MPKNAKKKQNSKRAQKKAAQKRTGGKKSGPNRKGGKRVLAKQNRPQKEKIHKLIQKRLPEIVNREKRREADVFENSEENDQEDADEENLAQQQADDAEAEKEIEEASTNHTAFATKLSHCEKSVRDKGFKSLQKWLKKKGEKLTELDFVKLWRALFYCLWMSDKKPVQQALSVHIAQLTRSIATEKLPLWFASFFEVFQTEWPKLDTWRMNKFLLMVRIQLAEMFAVLASHNFDEDLVEECNSSMLSFAPLCLESTFNPGFAQQVAACFWDELTQTFAAERKKREQNKENRAEEQSEKASTQTPINEEETTMHLLEPWMQILADPSFSDSFLKTVVKEVFSAKLPEHMRKPVAEEFFSIATDEELIAHKRQTLMTIVKQLKDKDLPVEEVAFPERELKLNPKLEAPRKRLRKGLGVRTRNQRKVRQRDKGR